MEIKVDKKDKEFLKELDKLAMKILKKLKGDSIFGSGGFMQFTVTKNNKQVATIYEENGNIFVKNTLRYDRNWQESISEGIKLYENLNNAYNDFKGGIKFSELWLDLFKISKKGKD
jgi:hypothetical protein